MGCQFLGFFGVKRCVSRLKVRLVVKKLDGYRVETVLVNLKFEAEDEK